MSQSPARSAPRADIRLRGMTEDDLAPAAALSKALRWPHRPEDWDFMFRQGQGVVAVDPEGQVIGSTLWWRFGDMVTIGLVIVANAWQGHGIGRALMSDVRHREPGGTLVLNATIAGRPLYEKLGFAPIGVVEQHQGTGATAPIVALGEGQRLRPVVVQDAAEISALDAAAVGAPRETLIEGLVREARGVVIDTEAGIRGYAFCRRFGWGWLIGPVAAQCEDEARALISHWIGTLGGEFIRIDIPVTSGLSAWLDERGLVRVDAVSTMATDALAVASGGATYYALTAQAIG